MPRPDSGDWHVLVDLDRLGEWMDGQGLPPGPIGAVEQLSGGTQNILLRFARGGRTFVLRRPPLVSIAGGSRTMRREARALAAIADSAVPHPRLIAACDSEDVLGAAFYLMEPVTGFNASVGLPPLHAGDPMIRRQMGFALLDGILALGAIDPLTAGLDGFGRLDGYLERQAAQWRQQYDSYRQFAGWPDDALDGIDQISAWLDAHRPPNFTPGIIHGDYHLANVMFRLDGPQLAAIVDWELASLGDPLVDLGWLLATWHDPADGESVVPVSPQRGFPSEDEMIAYYAERSPRDLGAIAWYKVLACYKLGILLEGTHARAMAGQAEVETGRKLHESAKLLLRRAFRTMDQA